MSGPELCLCGHLAGGHGVGDDPLEKDSICGEPGCPCERFRSFEALPDEVVSSVHAAPMREPSPPIVQMLAELLEGARSGEVNTPPEALWALEKLKQRLLSGAWGSE